MDRTAVYSLVDDFVEAWNRRDLERFLSFLTDDVVWDDPAMLYGPAIGKEAARSFSERVLRAFPDFSYGIRGSVCVSESGDRCVVPWEITATHLGYFDPPGFAPTHQKITMRGVDILELRDGKICRVESLFNIVPAIEQVLRIKLIPRRGSLKECVMTWLQRTRACRLKHAVKKERLTTGK